jgi:hypothetical protein
LFFWVCFFFFFFFFFPVSDTYFFQFSVSVQYSKHDAPHPARVPRSKYKGGKLRGLAQETCWEIAMAIDAATRPASAPGPNTNLVAQVSERAQAAHASMVAAMPELAGDMPFRTTRTMVCSARSCPWRGNAQHRDDRATVDIRGRGVLALAVSADLLPTQRMSPRQLGLLKALRAAADGVDAANGVDAADAESGAREALRNLCVFFFFFFFFFCQHTHHTLSRPDS